MDELKIPDPVNIQCIRQDVAKALGARFGTNADNEITQQVCAVCDCFITIDNPSKWIPIFELSSYCRRSGAEIAQLIKYFPEKLVFEYKNEHPIMANFAISTKVEMRNVTSSLFAESEEEEALVCTLCHETWEKDILNYGGKASSRKRKIPCPPRAIWNGNMIGQAPDCLKELTIAELAIVSPNRVISHGVVLYADQHRGVYGWHAMYENDVSANIGNIQQLVEAGLSGEIVCVLCGPFTRAQQAVVRTQFAVRSEKIIAAFEWLKANNHFFSRFEMPSLESMKMPVILYNDNL